MSILSAAFHSAEDAVTSEFSWIKWAAIGMGVLAIVGVIGAGLWHIQSMQKDLEKVNADLAQERVLHQAADARANAIVAEHDSQIDRINQLEDQRSNIAVEVTKLRSQIQELDIESDIEGDNEDKAQAAVAALNARSADIDRRLRNVSRPASGQVRSGNDRAGKASPTWTSNPLQRALQALRKEPVSDGR